MVKKKILTFHQHYSRPTTLKFRKIGDALLGVSGTIAGFSMYNDNKTLAMTALITAVAGKFITNLFKDEE